jgi:hypothetical protein
MEPGPHPDPFAEALSSGSQKVAQIASLVAATSQILVQQHAIREARKATADEQARRVLDEQERQIRQQTRMAWAPANDRKWLRAADLLQTGRAWAAAAAHSDDPIAITTMYRCEDRLRTIHPYAMAYYDLLRGDGVSPLDAMRTAAPLFGRPAHVRVGDPAPTHPELTATAADGTQAAETTVGVPAESGENNDNASERAEYRARQIARQLQNRAREHNRPPLSRDELTIVLDTITNLPYPIIETIAGEAAITPRATAWPAHIAAHSFPRGVADAAMPTTSTAQSGGQATIHRSTSSPRQVPGI